MQESERKYKWYYSPKCTFKNEKKAGREKTMVSVLTRAKKCAKISFVFEKDAGVAQSVEQLIRNQQVMCSSHTTSSKKHRKPRLSVLFCCKNAEKGVGQNVGQLPDPHRDPHRLAASGFAAYCQLMPHGYNEMRGKSQRAPERKLLPFRCSFGKMPLPYLRHEAAHFLRGLLLHLPCDVGVGSQGESRVVVTEH